MVTPPLQLMFLSKGAYGPFCFAIKGVMMETGFIIFVIVLVLLIIISRKRSATTITYTPETIQTGSGSADKTTPQWWTGNYNSVNYTVECLGHIADWPLMTVWIDLPEPISQKLEVNAREKQPLIPEDKRREDIKALLELGIEYIDIGYSTDWIAAELAAGKSMDHPLAELIAKHLIKLRELSK